MVRDIPLVSVVIPSYECGKYIGGALRSVREQEYPNTEVIVVDDGSSDDTKQVVAVCDPRVIYVRQERSGPASARNTGILASRGDYIAFLDADDEWLPGKTWRQVAVFRQQPIHYRIERVNGAVGRRSGGQ